MTFRSFLYPLAPLNEEPGGDGRDEDCHGGDDDPEHRKLPAVQLAMQQVEPEVV